MRGEFCLGNMIPWERSQATQTVLFHVSRLPLRGNRLLSPTSPIYSQRVQHSGQSMKWNRFIARNHSESLKAVAFLMPTSASPKHSPAVPSPAHWPEEPCRLTSAIYNQLVHATRAQGGSYSLCNHLAGADVTYKLGDALGAIGPLFQQDNWCGLKKKEQWTAFNNHLLQ